MLYTLKALALMANNAVKAAERRRAYAEGRRAQQEALNEMAQDWIRNNAKRDRAEREKKK